MGTPYSTIIDAFLRRIEMDHSYFFYRNLDDDESMALARERAFIFLDEACGRIMMVAMPTVNFTIGTDADGSFDFDVTPQEKLLLTSLMYEYYMSRDIARLKTYDVNFTGTEMRVFDPSNARKTFLSMYQDVKAENEILLDTYKNTDRLTGRYNAIDYDSY